MVEKTQTPVPYSEDKSIKRMTALRAQLMAAAIRHVKEGKVGTPQDRVREAGHHTGIPQTFIEVALKK